MSTTIDTQNSIFWNEMCGTTMANSLGIVDDSPASLKKYDDYYLDYYPYLLKHVPVHQFSGLKVLEVGLGYGTLSQKIAENAQVYRGLDIALGPVNLVNKRIKSLSIDGEAIVGSIKEAPFEDNSFDVVVAIGCYHHTGDLRKAISETSRILKKGGRCYLMVYNKYSYRQWVNSPSLTLKRFLKEKLKINVDTTTTSQERAAFDTNLTGEAAPETQFFSVSELHSIMSDYFTDVRLSKENFDPIRISRKLTIAREKLLKNISKVCGLDIYFTGEKK